MPFSAHRSRLAVRSHLKGLTNLKELYLYGCTKITDAALKKALPNCKIKR